MIRSLFCLFFLFAGCAVQAQDTLLLISGKVIPAKSVDLKDYTIAYRKPGDGSKLKTIDPERVFSIQYGDGSERIIYTPDTLDPMEFTVSQMRNFIKGEQEASRFYKSTTNKGLAFVVGGGASILGFYGLAIPPLYSTVIGSFSPNLNKLEAKQEQAEKRLMTVKNLSNVTDADYQHELMKAEKNLRKNLAFTDKSMIQVSEFREGYERKVRDRKIRNSLLSGLAGFVSGAALFTFLY